MTAHFPSTRAARSNPTGTRTRRLWVCAAAVAAPVLFMAGQSLLPDLGANLDEAVASMTEQRGRLLLSRYLTTSGAFLFVPAVVALWSLAPAGVRGSRLLLVGGIMFGVGTFFNGLSQAVHGYVQHAATGGALAPPDAVAIIEAMDQLGLVGLPISFLSIPLFAFGGILIGVALLCARTVPTWLPILLLVGIPLAGATAGMGPVAAVAQLPLTVGFVILGVLAARHLLGAAEADGASPARSNGEPVDTAGVVGQSR